MTQEDPLYYPQGALPQQESEAASTLRETNPDTLFNEIVHMLKGEVFDPTVDNGKGNWIVPKGASPLMNEQGAWCFAYMLKGLLNQNTVLSNIPDEETINKIMLPFMNDVLMTLYERYLEFGIKKGPELDAVKSLVQNTGELCLRRPYHNLERVFHKSTLSEIRHYDPRMQAAGLANAKHEKKGWGLFGGKDK